MDDFELRIEATSLVIDFVKTEKVNGNDLDKVKGGNIAEVLVNEAQIVFDFLKHGKVPA
jgi:hypothetical protein